MVTKDPLQQFRGLDRASPHFYEHLSNVLRGNEYQNILPKLQSEDLAWLVEYLDDVSLQITFLHTALIVGVGYRRGFRRRKNTSPGTTQRTQKDMWQEGSVTEIMYTFGISLGMCV